MANSAGFHEPFERLTPQTRDLHRALTSLQDELEAIDWYQQRIDVIEDPALKDILEGPNAPLHALALQTSAPD